MFVFFIRIKIPFIFAYASLLAFSIENAGLQIAIYSKARQGWNIALIIFSIFID
jgi:hypothetical protein